MPNALRGLLRNLFSRKRVTAEASGRGEISSTTSEGSVSEVWLYPDSKALHKQTLLKARKIEQPLFQIGRRISDAVHYPHENPPDLLIVENPPYTLSRLQCEIEIKENQVTLRDLGSRAGTMLGDKRLKESSRKPSSIVVPKGSHSLILGPRSGPFRFRLEVR